MAEAIALVVRELGVERYGVFGTDAFSSINTAVANNPNQTSVVSAKSPIGSSP